MAAKQKETAHSTRSWDNDKKYFLFSLNQAARKQKENKQHALLNTL